MLHQGNFSAKNHPQARGKCPRGSRDAPKVCSFSVSLVATTALTAPWGNLLTQRTVAHLNWLRSQSAPLVPKNSKERGSSKDPERGSAPVAGSPRTGRREHPALSKADHPTPDTALGSTCWGVPSPETSLHKLTTPGERSGVTFSSRFGYLLPQALGVRCNPDTQQPPNSLLTWESSF